MATYALLSSKWFVQNMGAIHGGMGWVLGSNVANWTFRNSLGRCFVGGSSLKQMQSVVRNSTQPLFVGYYPSRLYSGPLDEWHIHNSLHKIEFLTELIEDSPTPTLTLRLSTLMNHSLLQKYARSLQLKDLIWEQFSEDGSIIADALFQAYQQVHPGLDDEHLETHLKLIHGW